MPFIYFIIPGVIFLLLGIHRGLNIMNNNPKKIKQTEKNNF